MIHATNLRLFAEFSPPYVAEWITARPWRESQWSEHHDAAYRAGHERDVIETKLWAILRAEGWSPARIIAARNG